MPKNNQTPPITSGRSAGIYLTEVPEHISTACGILEQKKHTLNTLKTTAPKGSDLWQKVLEKLRVDWTYHSNAIEGSTLTHGETLFFLQEGLTVEGKPFKDFLDAQNHAEAIDILFEIVANKRAVSESLIKEINALLLNGIRHTPAKTLAGGMVNKPVHAGDYKKLPNHVLKQDGSLHQYVLPEQVAIQMAALVSYIQKPPQAIHAVVVAALAHYNMVRIHPFDDANGRGARILMNLILMRAGFFPAVIKKENKRQYLLALEQADEGDIMPFIGFIISQLDSTLDEVISNVQRFI